MSENSRRPSSWIALLVTSVSVFAALPVAHAGPGAGDPVHMGAGPGAGVPLGARALERLSRDLGLSPSQQQTLRGIYESARPEMEQTAKLARENAARLRAVTPDDPTYQSVVAQVARTSGELATRAITNQAQLRAQTWAVLTPEQRTKWQALQAERRARFQDMREKRRIRVSQGAGAASGR